MPDTGVAELRSDFLEHAKEDREAFGLVHTKLDKMASDHPTNGELGIMIAGVAKDITEIKVQTTKTNGRVTDLEVDNNKNKGKGTGMRNMWGWVTSGILFIVMVAAFLLPHLK